MTAENVKRELQKHANEHDVAFLQHFFRTGPGEYAEGDQLIGVRVPNTRRVVRQFRTLPRGEIAKLIKSPIHEHRMAGLLIAVEQYKRGDHSAKEKIYQLYCAALENGYINNWDLVDVTAEHIVGDYLADKDKQPLRDWSVSSNLWERRAAIISTFFYIKRGEPGLTLELAKMYLGDPHDLIHKASGWMLREVGKRCDTNLLILFLDRHAPLMPRTMLRYAVEKLPEETRQYYLTLPRRPRP